MTDARSWFGLTNQIAWTYANADVVQPFRDLVKPNTKFHWDDDLERLFKQSKNIRIERSIEGIKIFDTSRNTILQTDFCSEGISYLLLQQHGASPMAKAPE